jgi:hypothetical protein
MNLLHTSGDSIYSGIKQLNSPGSEPSGTAARDSVQVSTVTSTSLSKNFQLAGVSNTRLSIQPLILFILFFSLDLFYPILPRGITHEHTTMGF